LKRALDEVSLKIQPCVKILARLTIPEDKTLAEKIAEYNNSQTEVIPRDFRANDAIQIRLQKEFEKKSFLYIRKRGETEILTLTERRKKKIIDMEKLAQILFAFYHDKPSEAKAEKAKLFDKKHPYYKTIFHSNIVAEDCILPFLIREDISARQTELRRLRNQLRKDNIENTDAQWDQYNSNEFILHSDLHILCAVKHLINLKYKKIDSQILGSIRRSENCSVIITSLVKMAIRAINRLVREAESAQGFALTKYFKSEEASQSIGTIVRDLNKDARDLYSKKSLVEDILWP